MGKIQIIQNADNFNWFGIPFEKRFGDYTNVGKSLMKRIWEIDELLDFKRYLPNGNVCLIRYYNGRSCGKFTKVWELKDAPEQGLKSLPGDWIIDALRAGDLKGKAEKRINEIDEHNSMIEAKNDETLADHCKDVAVELRKPLQNLYDYGPNHDHKGVF